MISGIVVEHHLAGLTAAAGGREDQVDVGRDAAFGIAAGTNRPELEAALRVGHGPAFQPPLIRGARRRVDAGAVGLVGEDLHARGRLARGIEQRGADEKGVPGSVAGAMRSVLVTRAGLSFCAASNSCRSFCAAGAATVTSAVTRVRIVVFMRVRRRSDGELLKRLPPEGGNYMANYCAYSTR